MCGWWPPPPQRRKEKKKKKTNTKRKSWVVNTGEEDNNKFSVLAKHSQCELVKTLEMLLANENKSWVRSKRKVKVSRLGEVFKIKKTPPLISLWWWWFSLTVEHHHHRFTVFSNSISLPFLTDELSTRERPANTQREGISDQRRQWSAASSKKNFNHHSSINLIRASSSSLSARGGNNWNVN